MKKTIFYVIFFTLVICCTKDDEKVKELALSSEPPEIPQTVKFDLNSDGIDDISFEFGPDDVVTDGTVGYYGSVYPLNGAMLLLETLTDGAYALETQLNDSLRKEETTSLTWYPSNWIFMFIDDSPEGLWPNDWSLSSTNKSNPYYLGLQVKQNDTFLLGWLKLEIDTKTGVIEIIDHEITSDDFIVVDR